MAVLSFTVFFLLFSYPIYVSSSPLNKDWQSGEGIIFSSNAPKDGYYPNIGNGFIASIVGCYVNASSYKQMTDPNTQIGSIPCGNIFMQAVYNGNLSDYNKMAKVYKNTSNRARIPGIHSIYIDNDSDNQYNLTWIGANIDIPLGTVNNRSIISHPTKCPKGGEIQIARYMHRYFRSLMVLNITLITGDTDCQIVINNCNLKSTNDFIWREYPSKNKSDITLREMTIRIPEETNSPLINIGMAYQNIPNNLTLSNNNPSIAFYGVLHNSLPLDTV